MTTWLQDDLIQIRHGVVTSYALLSSDEVTLIDGGFIGGMARLDHALKAAHRPWSQVKAVLLTHGHLDHTLNIAEIRRKSNAVVYAQRLDEKHVEGKYPYKGISRVCGILEAFGRVVLKYSSPQVDVWMDGTTSLPFWGGLTVVPLPGHTDGHCGYFSPRSGILFAGDSFASWWFGTDAPPPWFNSDSVEARRSLTRINELNPGGILVNHCDKASPSEQKARFCRLVEKRGA